MARYTGQYVKLWPYARGAYGRDTLYRLWSLVEQEQAWTRIFWGLSAPAYKFGDLEHFLHFFAEDSGRQLCIFQDVEQDRIAGFVWFDVLTPQVQTMASVFMTKAYRGRAAQEAIRLGLDFAFHEFHYVAVWGFTPWKEAQRLICSVGFQRMATLPHFGYIQDTFHDIGVYRITRDHYYGKHIS